MHFRIIVLTVVLACLATGAVAPGVTFAVCEAACIGGILFGPKGLFAIAAAVGGPFGAGLYNIASLMEAAGTTAALVTRCTGLCWNYLALP